MLIVFLAGYLREKREVLAQGRLKDFGPLLVIWGGAMLVLVQTNDLGSALLYFGIFLGMLYVATGRLATSPPGSRSSSPARPPPTSVVPRVQDRVSIWLDPWPRPQDEGYQLVQSHYSIAHGGFGGTGLGKGTFTTRRRRPADPVPEHRLHLLGARAGARPRRRGRAAARLHALRRARLPHRAARDDGFSKLLAAGLTFGFALQTFIILGGILRLIPLTGITLPFVSYGGSSVLANFVLLAGLLLVSNRANAPPTAREPADHPPRRRRRRPARPRSSSRRPTGRRWAAAGLADRQDNAIQRVAQFTIKRGEIFAADGTGSLADERQRKVEGQDALLPPLPDARPRSPTSSATRRRCARARASSAR